MIKIYLLSPSRSAQSSLCIYDIALGSFCYSLKKIPTDNNNLQGSIYSYKPNVGHFRPYTILVLFHLFIFFPHWLTPSNFFTLFHFHLNDIQQKVGSYIHPLFSAGHPWVVTQYSPVCLLLLPSSAPTFILQSSGVPVSKWKSSPHGHNLCQ